jgi:hypothetical protein
MSTLLCEHCQEAPATLEVATMQRNSETGRLEPLQIALHLCAVCADKYHRSQAGRRLGAGQQPIKELVRVVSVTPEWTIYRVVRTDSHRVPEEWRLVTNRVPARAVGSEFTITYAPEELQFMNGEEPYQ